MKELTDKTRTRLTAAAVILAALAVFGPSGIARAQLARRGGEFLINSVTEGNQRRPRIAPLPNGGFVVVWENEGQVATRRFDAATQPLGSELQVNSQAACYPPEPSLAAAPDGSLLIAWCAVNSNGRRFIDGQRFDASGEPQGGEFTIAEDPYAGPHVAAVGNDQFVVTWTGYYEGHARLVGPSEQEPPFGLAPNEDQYSVAAAGNGGGLYRIVWYDGGGLLRGRPFQGRQPSGDAFEIGHVHSTRHQGPVICSNATGEFVVSWSTYGSRGDDVPVTYRRYDASGAPITEPLPITPEDPFPFQVAPAIACGLDAAFAITWVQVPANPTRSLFKARAFTPDRPPAFSDLSIGIRTPAQSGMASISYLADGDLLIAWHDCGLPSGCDIFAQRFTFASATDCPGDCNRDGDVTIDELVSTVSIALDPAHPALAKACLPADVNLDYRVTIEELVLAAGRALRGCR